MLKPLVLAALAWGLVSPVVAQTDAKACAVVLMHGKWGNPQYLVHFGRRLEPVCAYRSIEMPWAKRRAYDQAYPVALDDVAKAVQAFRTEGYRRVLLAGHSFGANAALAYMATKGDADGVIALAAGHSPQYSYSQGIGKDAVDKARDLVAQGKGDESVTMDDLNQGRRESIRMPATSLWSYFDPNGLGHMPKTASEFKKPVPFLWVIGTGDPLFRAGEAFIYAKAPPHPLSRYLVVEAGHANTPDVAVDQVVDWLKQVVAAPTP
jgi:pimeloyl-ACP methyl ester carboxylesterase